MTILLKIVHPFFWFQCKEVILCFKLKTFEEKQ